MQYLRRSASFVAAIAFAAGTVAPAWSYESPVGQMQDISAEVVPTQQQAGRELSNLHVHLQAAEQASFYSPKAESEYLAARRMYDFGRYDESVAHAERGLAALPDLPNGAPLASALR